MKSYSLYEKLNIYFSNEHFNEIVNSIDEILILANLKDYIIDLDPAHEKNKGYNYATIDIEQTTSITAIVIHFNYKIINEICVCNSIELYYRSQSDTHFNKIFHNYPINVVLNSIKELI